MTNLSVSFGEYLSIQSALQEAIAEARHQAWRGDLHDNPDMREHFEEHANTLSALKEKLQGQAKA